MNFETCMYALTVAGLAFGLGYLVGLAADQRAAPAGNHVVNEIEVKGSKLPIQPPTRLPAARVD